MGERTRQSGGSTWRVVLTVVVCGVLVGIAIGVHYLIHASEPTAQSESATRRSAALVETVAVSRGTYRPQLDVLGVVEPAQDIVLSPRVSGEIVRVQPAFVPGGLVAAGDELLKIDPADFERALAAREGEVMQAEAALAIEQGRQIVARQEYELLGQDVDPENRGLILREPQIEAIRAQLQAARAAMEQAQLDLDRTTVAAPFDAQILTRTCNIGSQVGPGDGLARLVGVDEYWIMASVPLRDLRWLRFPQDDAPGSSVRVRHATAWEPDVYRAGSVARLIGTVDQQTRMARVLISVPDPLARQTDGPPLILETIVELWIEAQPLNDVIRLNRAYLRQNDTVWVYVDSALEIRKVEVAFEDAQFAYIRHGLEAGERVVTTSLATVVDGLPLRQTQSPDDEQVARLEPAP